MTLGDLKLRKKAPKDKTLPKVKKTIQQSLRLNEADMQKFALFNHSLAFREGVVDCLIYMPFYV